MARCFTLIGIGLVLGTALFSASANTAAASDSGRWLGHVERVESDPAPGARLPRAPAGVFVTFSSPVSEDSQLEVLGQAFQRVDVGATRVEPDGVTLSIGLQPDAHGELTVQYSAVDVTDSHATNGSFSFTVQGAGGSADPGQTDQPAVPVEDSAAEDAESGNDAPGGETMAPGQDGPDPTDTADRDGAEDEGSEGTEAEGPGAALIVGLLVLLGAGLLIFVGRRGRSGGPPGIGSVLLCGLLLGLAGCDSTTSVPDPEDSVPAVDAGTVEIDSGRGPDARPATDSTDTNSTDADITDAGVADTETADTDGADTVGASTVVAASDLGVGQDRFAFALLDQSGAPIANADAKVTFYHLDGEVATPVEEAAATYYPGAIENAGLYVVNTEFDQAGTWGAEIQAALPDGSPVEAQRIRFDVAQDPSAPAVGEAVPPTDNRTLDDAALEAITSDPDPDSSFYSMTVDEAAASGQPTVVVFATPAYCASRICGPVLDEVKSVATNWSDSVNFIHIEVYESFEPLELSPLMDQWGLTTEPWVFVLDEEGRVAARLEGSVTAAELEPILEKTVGQREGRGPGAGAHLSHDPHRIL